MPIDLRRLSQDPEQQARYQHALSLRTTRPDNDSNNNNEEAQRLVWHSVLDLRQETLKIWKERDRLVAQSRKMNKQDKLLLKEQIHKLTEQHGQLQEQLERAWNRLPNFVDTELELTGNESTHDSPVVNGLGVAENGSSYCTHDDIFFSLGGYEEMGGFSVLTRIGMNLMDNLDRHVQQSWIEKLKATCLPPAAAIQVWELPMTVDMKEAQDTSKTQNNNSVDSTKQKVPSWLFLLQQQHTGQVFFDQQLPLLHLLTCTTTQTFSTAGDCCANREAFRRASWCRRKHPGWYQRMATPQRCWQIMAVTGPCLKADSQPLQQQLVQAMVEWFCQLVPLVPHCNVCARILSPSELLPAEASSVVVEGSFGNTKSRRTVCLGYICNLLDYASMNIRHGLTREGLHVLVGTLCSLPETLEWILQNNSLSSSTAIALPECLSSANMGSLPLVRRIVTTKNGKKIIQNMQQQQQVEEPQVDNPSDAHDNDDDDAINPTKGITLLPNHTTELTPDEIRLEAMSCPFDFLPFYYR